MMGIDYYNCANCGEIFPDCGYFVSCEGCGTFWCSEECAKADGWECKEDDDGDYIYEESTCGYCRGEHFNDDELFSLALELLGKTRDELSVILRERKK